MLVTRLPQHTLNVNTEYVRKSKQLCSLCDHLLGAVIHFYFIVLILMFLIDYAWCELSNIWLLLFENNSRSTIKVAVINQDRLIDGNLKRQVKNQTLHTRRLFPIIWIFQYISNWSKVFELLITLFLQYI